MAVCSHGFFFPFLLAALLLPSSSCPGWCGIGTPYLRRFIPIFAGEVLCQYSSLCHPRLSCSICFGFLFLPCVGRVRALYFRWCSWILLWTHAASRTASSFTSPWPHRQLLHCRFASRFLGAQLIRAPAGDGELARRRRL
ncbi:hypothetical protein BDA96_03G098100 [Sorghum bicolor]|uniref:Secreted protein n=1 Tax=Sorghum bicolor TaxID=4558 RepID=A0A921RCL6_SORBI|nr:hypothetical protein BDA96_03G098100 [Sorghum bicolor]